MYKINFKEPIHIHFIGIGGISMSGLAEILSEEHFTVSGSDAKESDLTRHLEHLGIKVYYGQTAANITDDIDLVVYTAAIHEDNPEFACAREKGKFPDDAARRVARTDHGQLPQLHRGGRHPRQDDHDFHDQPDPSCSQVRPDHHSRRYFKSARRQPAVASPISPVGSVSEYTNSFLRFLSEIPASILNIEAEHLDFFKIFRTSAIHSTNLHPTPGRTARSL